MKIIRIGNCTNCWLHIVKDGFIYCTHEKVKIRKVRKLGSIGFSLYTPSWCPLPNYRPKEVE